jgi:hypothetical protein
MEILRQSQESDCPDTLRLAFARYLSGVVVTPMWLRGMRGLEMGLDLAV